MMNASPPSPAAGGSAVVLEPESRWPAQAFAANADRDCVMVVRMEPNLSVPRLVERIVTHSAEFERSGTKLRTVILACTECDSVSRYRQLPLVRALLHLLTSGDGRLVLTSTPNQEPALVKLARVVCSELQERSITFMANELEVFTPTPPRDLGVYFVRRETCRELNTYSWLPDAELRETVRENVQ